MATPSLSEILATTIENRSGKVRDNVTKNNALLMRLKEKGNIRKVSGGSEIIEEVAFAENPNGGWYSGYDPLPVNAADVLSAARFQLKQLAVPVTISGLDQLQNSGKEAIIDLMEQRLKVAEATMANLISAGLYGDGTAFGGKTITGLDAAVSQSPTSGTYGSINRALWPFWRNQVRDPASTPTATTIQQEMNGLWAACTRGTDRPDLIVAGSTVWQTFMASVQPLQRFTNPDKARLGFESTTFITADVVLDGGIGGFATPTDMYFLNTNYLHFRPHKDRDMVPLSPQKRYAVNQDAEVQILAWAGNLTCSGAQYQGRAKFD